MRPGALAATGAVFRHELRLLFLSPAAWVFLSGFTLLAGLFFALALAGSGEASLREVVPNWAVLLVFGIPLVTMRQLAEEDRSGTAELLRAAPVPLGAVIGGKWLAATGLCVVLLGLTLPVPAALILYGDPDPAVLFTTYLGLGLCCAGFAAGGLFASSLTRDPTVAGVLGVLLLLPSWVAGGAADLVPGALRPWLLHLSVVDHLRGFAIGVVDLGDVGWLLGFAATFLFLTWRSLEARRWA